MTCSVYHYSQLVQWELLPVTTMMLLKSYLEQNLKKILIFFNWFVLSLMWTDQLENNERVAPLPYRGPLLPHNALIRRNHSLEFALWFHIFSEMSLSVAAYTFLVTCIIFMQSLRLNFTFFLYLWQFIYLDLTTLSNIRTHLWKPTEILNRISKLKVSK